MAQSEFALVRHHLEVAIQKKPLLSITGERGGSDYDLYAMLADTAAQQHDEAALRQYAPLAEETATRYDHKLYQAIAHRAWGVAHRLAGEYAQAEARLNQALILFQGLETRWQMGRTLFELGQLAQAQTNTAAARNYFSHALVMFTEMGAVPDATRTQVVLESVA